MNIDTAYRQRILPTIHRVLGPAPYPRVRLPDPAATKQNNRQSSVLTVDVWTRDCHTPRIDNLSVLVAESLDGHSQEAWSRRLVDYQASAAVLPAFGGCTLLFRDPGDRITSREVDDSGLAEELARRRAALFTPQALSAFSTGQLSFAALETQVSIRSFSYLLKERDNLADAVTTTVSRAITVESEDRVRHGATGHSGFTAEEDVIRVAFAYIAARILEDKGFFGEDAIPEYNPSRLLDRAVARVNGFLRRTRDHVLNNLCDAAQQVLAKFLGMDVTFALMDYLHIGQIYERMTGLLPEQRAADISGHLQRHYTPDPIAIRLLEHLPVERLRPKARVIFDPAAGSGTLLLAATRRLAALTDIPSDEHARRRYLETHVAGNDLDEHASLVTYLRYLLIHESYRIPFPKPTYFGVGDFARFDVASLTSHIGHRPTIIVANPPFQESGDGHDSQLAAGFVERALSWMRPGDMFGFILPQTFLHSRSHGYGKARRTMLGRCELFDVWELPETSVGLSARQATCVVLGAYGARTASAFRMRMAISETLARDIREKGYLGQSWLSASTPRDGNAETTAGLPNPVIKVPVIALEKLFHPFIGVTLIPGVLPVAQPVPGVTCRRYWMSSWREAGRVWANPARVPTERRWIRYVREGVQDEDTVSQREFLKKPEWRHRALFDQPKLLVGNSTNRNARTPLPVCLDAEGLCPNKDIYCISTIRPAVKCGLQASKTPDVLPPSWQVLNDEDQLLWLLGILSSDLANELSLVGRTFRHWTMKALRSFPLPSSVDPDLIKVMRKMVARDRNNESLPSPDPLRLEMNDRVEALYGHPRRLGLSRVGESESLQSWNDERETPALLVTGQVLEVVGTGADSRIRICLDGLIDEENEAEIPFPHEMPGWALDGAVFTAEMSSDIRTFEQLSRRPWALRRFRHSPRPYLTADELVFRFRE